MSSRRKKRSRKSNDITKEVENDILYAAKLGGKREMQVVIDHWGWMADFIPSKYGFDEYLELEDLVMIGLQIIIKSVRTFDPERGSRFFSYLNKAIYSQMMREARRNLARSKSEFTYGIVNARVDDIEGDDNVFENVYENGVRGACMEAIKELKGDSKKIMNWYYMKGMTAREISKKLGVTTQAVHSRMKDAREMLRETYSLKSGEIENAVED